LEVIIEIVLLILFIYPGAFIRWILTGCRRPFKKVVKDDGYMNGVVGLVSTALIVLAIKKIFFFNP
jgi:hypothetical protein